MELLASLRGPEAALLIFITLYVSGAGVPLPEEIPLATGGYLVGIGALSFFELYLTVSAAIVLGDLTAYWLGRTFGERLIGFPPFSWILNEKRLQTVHERFQRHAGKAIFFGRFLAGLRFATFVLAGMNRVRVVKFALLDYAAACVTAPVPITIAYLIGDPTKARKIAEEFDLVLAGVVVIGLVIGVMVYRFWQKRHGPDE